MPEDFTSSTGADDNGSSFDEFLARYMAGERARAERSIDLSRFLSARTQDVLQRAGRFALERGQRELDALHVLRVLVGEDPAKDAVAADRRRSARDRCAPPRSGCPRHPRPADVDGAVIAASVQRALFHAFQVARSSGSTYVDPEHLFFALVLAQDTPAGQVLARAGVTAEALTQGMRETVAPTGAPSSDDAGGCRGIRHPDARQVRHRPHRARPRGRARPRDRPRRRDRADDRDPEPPHQEQPRARGRGRRRQDRDRRGTRVGDRRRAPCPSSCATSASSPSTCPACSPAPATAATSRSA